MKNLEIAAAATLCGSLLAYAAPAFAQGSQSAVRSELPEAAASADPNGGDIVVTARTREETLIDVPVSITAVTGAELAKRGINSIDGISRIVPQLVTGDPSRRRLRQGT